MSTTNASSETGAQALIHVGTPAEIVLDPSAVYALAYERYRDAIEAIPADELVAVNLDVPTAATAVLARVRGIEALRDEIASRLSDFDPLRFDALEGVANAVLYAHATYLIASAPIPVLPELNEAAVALRDQLAAEVGMLARRKLVDPGRVGELKGPIGYKNVALDLVAIAALLRTSWPAIVGRTAIEPEDIARADRLAHELLRAVVAREEKPEKVAEAALDRQRAFTLFSKTYDYVRRAVAYVRWDAGDADVIAPSLFAGRGAGRRREADAPALAPSALPVPPSPLGLAADPGLPDGDPFLP